VIRGQIVNLRALEPEDIPLVNRWRNDPKVLGEAYGEMLPPESLEATQRWSETWTGTEVRTGLAYLQWGVECDDKLIGLAQLFDMDWRVYRLAEHGIGICDLNKQNSPAGVDTLITLNEYAFEGMNLNRLWVKIPIYRESTAQQLIDHLGYVREGLLREQYYVSGKYVDTLVLGLLRRDFENAIERKTRKELFDTVNINFI
jgi:RimJ/RimL family protein N-acetyltransferase